jgi:ketosteroid isomerase-like protein
VIRPASSPALRALLLAAALSAGGGGCARPIDHPQIRAVLDAQVEAWNAGDLEGFMQGYWKSDELAFSSPASTTRGWQATLDGYRKRYPTREAMGRLRFEDLAIARTGPKAAEVSGRFILETAAGRKSGRFFLHMRELDGTWVIVRDHTTPE